MNAERRRRAERAQAMDSVHAVLCGLLLILILQFLLLGVSVDGLLAGKRAHLGAATAGSLVCFAGACWLLRYLHPGPVARDLLKEGRIGLPARPELPPGEGDRAQVTGRSDGANREQV